MDTGVIARVQNVTKEFRETYSEHFSKHPYTIAPLDIYKVSKAVNRAGYDSPQFIEKISETPL